jgi:hypothetical protein
MVTDPNGVKTSAIATEVAKVERQTANSTAVIFLIFQHSPCSARIVSGLATLQLPELDAVAELGCLIRLIRKA